MAKYSTTQALQLLLESDKESSDTDDSDILGNGDASESEDHVSEEPSSEDDGEVSAVAIQPIRNVTPTEDTLPSTSGITRGKQRGRPRMRARGRDGDRGQSQAVSDSEQWEEHSSIFRF